MKNKNEFQNNRSNKSWFIIIKLMDMDKIFCVFQEDADKGLFSEKEKESLNDKKNILKLFEKKIKDFCLQDLSLSDLMRDEIGAYYYIYEIRGNRVRETQKMLLIDPVAIDFKI